MARKNRTPEENARREKIRELLQMANIGSMNDIQNLFKETIAEFMENGLEAELDDELGYSKYDYKNKNTDNSRNGHSSKRLRTSFGEVDVSVPRDRKGKFEPQVLKKNQTSISQDIEEKILSMYAKGMTTSDISVNHNLIYRVIDGKAGFHITTPKTASGTRTIPILYPEVAEQLRALIEVMDALYPEDLVMNGYHGFLFRNRSGYFLSAHNINRAIERISIAYNAEEMDQAELEDREPDLLPHFSVHNLRHTFCTRLCESTNDIKFIQQVMGHADFSTTMDIYTHITQENMKEKAEVIKGNLVLM